MIDKNPEGIHIDPIPSRSRRGSRAKRRRGEQREYFIITLILASSDVRIYCYNNNSDYYLLIVVFQTTYASYCSVFYRLIVRTMSPRFACSHLATISDIPISEIVKSKEVSVCGSHRCAAVTYSVFQNVTCSDCNCAGPNLWVCLFRDCLRIGCSENFNDHSTLHNKVRYERYYCCF